MPQISNGWGRCVGVALCNAKGEGTTAFRQGEVAIFHYEFEVSRAIGAAIGGLVICNDKGTIVHGRNTWQFEETPSVVPTAGCTVLFTHEIVLDLAPGEYVFEVGLAAISEADWENRSRISHTEMSARHIRLCHVPKLGPFFISLADRDGVQILTHHGVANLPGSIRTRVVAATNS
jgi:lipopolysaccharide transport system ATP-binding protein